MPSTRDIHHIEMVGDEVSSATSESEVLVDDNDNVVPHPKWQRKTRRECLQEGVDLLAGSDTNNNLAYLSFVLSWVATLFGIFTPFDSIEATYRMFIFIVVLFLFNQSFFLVKDMRDKELICHKDARGYMDPLYYFLQGTGHHGSEGGTSGHRVVLYGSYMFAFGALAYGIIGMGAVPQSQTGLEDNNAGCFAWAAMGECESNAEYMQNTCALSCSNPGGVSADMARGYTRLYMILSIMFMVSSSLNMAQTLRDKFEAAVWYEQIQGRHIMSKRTELVARNVLYALQKHQGQFMGIYTLMCWGSLGIMIFAMIHFGFKEKGIGLLSAAMFMAVMASWNLARALDENKGKTDITVYVGFFIAIVLTGCGIIIPEFRDKMERILFILGIIIVIDSTFHVAKVFHRGERVNSLSKAIHRKFFLDSSSTEYNKEGGGKESKKEKKPEKSKKAAPKH